ncbi:MAG: hypothetical protein WC475_01860 [Candidatus Paceibacterota bacterium]
MKNKTIKNTILLLSLVSLPALVLAQVQQIPQQTNFSIQNIINMLNTVINWVFTILLLVAVIFILMAAFKYLGSAGNEEAVKTAQNQLIYAAVAIGVGLIAKGIEFIVRQLVGA